MDKSLKVGQKVQLVFQKGDTAKVEIATKIAEIFSESLVLSYHPSIAVLLSQLEEGDEVKAYIFCSAHIKVMESVVLDAPNGKTLEIDFWDDYETIQRRAYIREDLQRKVKIVSKGQSYDLMTADLGGGGFRFWSEEGLYETDDNEFILDIDNSGSKFLSGRGKILKKAHFKPEEYLLEYTEISEDVRSEILKRCILRQVEKLNDKQE